MSNNNTTQLPDETEQKLKQLQENGEPTPLNRTNYVLSISDRYESKADGLQNEGNQNPFDAYDNRDIEGDLLIQHTVDPTNNWYELRDNAGGMSETVLKDKFMTFEDGTKINQTSTRGNQGQGGSVFLGVGSLVEIETMKDGERTTARWTPEKRDFGFRDLQSLTEDGTIIRVENIRDEYMEDLRNVDHMENLMRRYWQKSLERDDVTITYEVKGYGSRQITPKEFDEDSITERKTITDIDGVEELEIIVFDEKRPEPFGDLLALNIYGQTIDWKNPRNVYDRDRVLAFAELDPEFKDAEYPNHRGFKEKENPKVKKTIRSCKDKIREVMDEYRDDPSGRLDSDQLNEAKKIINSLINGTKLQEELFGSDGSEGPPKEPTEKNNLFPQNVSIPDRDKELGDSFEVGVDVKNPKGNGYACDIELKLMYPLSKLNEVEDEVIETKRIKDLYVKGGKVEDTKPVDFTLPDDGIEGRYRIGVNVITKYRKNERIEGTTAWLTVGEDEDRSDPISNMKGINKPQGTEDEGDHKVMMSNNTPWINLNHPEFQNVLDDNRHKNAVRDYCVRNILTTLGDQLIEKRIEPEMDEEEVTEVVTKVRTEVDRIEGKQFSDEVEV